jgi:hypothetical protein
MSFARAWPGGGALSKVISGERDRSACDEPGTFDSLRVGYVTPKASFGLV